MLLVYSKAVYLSVAKYRVYKYDLYRSVLLRDGINLTRMNGHMAIVYF